MSTRQPHANGPKEGFDYIVVGAGTAGCVVAARLVRETAARVLLLERGGLDGSPLLHMPAGFIKMLAGHRDIEIHHSVPQPQLDGRVQTIPQGAVLGGSSSVNAMVYMRGRASEYDAWAASTGDPGWGWPQMLAHFVALEANQRLNDRFHGIDGPLQVSDSNQVCRMSSLYLQAMQELGIPLVDDFNTGRLEGVGLMQYTIDRERRRCSVVDAFLRPAFNERLVLVTGAKVTRIVIEHGVATGVEYVVNGHLQRASAESEIIVSSGSYVSPKLLMLSGIGPAAHLRRHGIAVKVDLPGVGQNLQDHHEVPVVAATHEALGYFGEDRGWRMLKNGLEYLLFREGPVSSVGVEACGYVLPDAAGEASIKMYCVPTIYLDRDVLSVAPTHGVTLNACLLQPKSRGSVELASDDPLASPRIDPQYLAEPEDLAAEIAGVRFARKILATRVLGNKVKAELLPGPAIQSDADLAVHCRRTVKTNYHPVGTCRMGRHDDATSVVAPDLRVHGVERLRVIDASVMPRLVSANTNAPTMAIANRAVSLLAGLAEPPPAEPSTSRIATS